MDTGPTDAKSLGQVARSWGADWGASRPGLNPEAVLYAAMMRGWFGVSKAGGAPNARERIVRVLVSHAHELADVIVLVEGGMSAVVELEDGGIEVDVRTAVAPPVPGERIPEDTFEKLASPAIFDALPDDLRAGIMALPIGREEFLAYLRATGEPDKLGWWPPALSAANSPGVDTPKPKLTSKAEADCKAWLRSISEKGEPPIPREELRDLAFRKFPGLSERGYRRARSDALPPSWKKPGRKAESLR